MFDTTPDRWYEDIIILVTRGIFMKQAEFMERINSLNKSVLIQKSDGTTILQSAGQTPADSAIDKGGPAVAFSRQTQSDAYKELYERGQALKPPYDFDWLTQLKEESDALQENVEAMVQNIVGMGFAFNYLGKDGQRRPKQASDEETELNDWFDEPNPDSSWLEIAKNSWTDREDLGNLGIEVIRNMREEILFAYHHPFKDMRLVPLKEEDYYVEDVPIRRKGQLVTVKTLRVYRRFVRYIKEKAQFRYYKSFGDPRPMLVNGKRLQLGQKAKPSQMASEILWNKQYIGGGSPYGLPRWIGSTFDVSGRRNAQAINWDLLRSQGIPPMAIMVNGTIDEGTWDQIWSMILASKGIENFSKIWVLQVKGQMVGVNKTGGASIEIKDLSSMQKTDSMFGNYIAGTEDRIRQNFRNPPCMIGTLSAYSYATLSASKTIGEEQVYGPERIVWDIFINRWLVRGRKGFGCEYWKYRTKGAQVASTSDLMQAVGTLATAGALTYNNAVEIANDALGRTFSKFDKPWGDLPVSIVQAIVNRENIIGTEDIISKQQEQTTAETPPAQQDFVHPEVTKQQKALKKQVQVIQSGLSKADILDMKQSLYGLKNMMDDINGQLTQLQAKRG